MLFLRLFLLVIIHLIVYEQVGFYLKKLFHSKFQIMNFIIGYLFVLFSFYLFQLIFNNYFIYFYLAFIFIFILFSLRKKRKYNYDIFVITGIFLFIIFNLTRVTEITNEANYFLTLIKQNGNLNTYQLFISSLTKLFPIDSTIYTLYVSGTIHSFIFLFTSYELITLLLKDKKQSRYAFIFFVLIFVACNDRTYNSYHPLNAYDFLHQMYLGKSVYLYSIIPLQFALLYRFDYKHLWLFLLINFVAVPFTIISITVQFIFNLSMYLLLFYLNKIKSWKDFLILILFTMTPLYYHYFAYLIRGRSIVPFYFLFWGSFIFLLLFPLIAFFLRKNKNTFLSITYLGFILLIIFFISNLLFQGTIPLSKETFINIVNYYINQKIPIMIFYLIGFYSLYQLRRWENDNIKMLLFHFPLILILFFLNPLTLLITTFYLEAFAFHYLIFLLPLAFSIIYVFFKVSTMLYKLYIVLLILVIPNSIFNNIPYIENTNYNIYYRINQDVYQVAEFIDAKEVDVNVLAVAPIIKEINLVTPYAHLVIDSFELNELGEHELALMYFTLMDKIPFEKEIFIEEVALYDIDTIIVYKENEINKQLTKVCKEKYLFEGFVLYQF